MADMADTADNNVVVTSSSTSLTNNLSRDKRFLGLETS
jgi:hypothetical protein